MIVAAVFGCVGVAFVASTLLWKAMAGVFAAPVLQRQNYAGRTLPIGSGIVIVLAVLLVDALAQVVVPEVIARREDLIDLLSVRASVGTAVFLVLGFAFLGLIDDLVGDNDRKGFRGHIGAALSGQVTTGFVKLVGGVLIAYLAFGAGLNLHGLRGTLLVAATANLGNLFDRAPGRTIKMSLLGAAVVAVCGLPLASLSGVLVVMAAALGVLWPDLRERCMLGDTGSNALGAVIGFGVVTALGTTGEWIALAVVVGLNLASEKVSFSRIIDGDKGLRWLDRLGSLRD